MTNQGKMRGDFEMSMGALRALYKDLRRLQTFEDNGRLPKGYVFRERWLVGPRVFMRVLYLRLKYTFRKYPGPKVIGE